MVTENNLELTYVVGDGPVKLTIIIGDGQIGGSALKMDGGVIGSPGVVEKQLIGRGPDLVNKVLEAKTLVADINDATDWTSVTYELTGGPPQQPVTAKQRVENEGDGVIYRTNFRFVASDGANKA